MKRKLPYNLLFHLLFWVASFYILLNVFASSSEIEKIDYIYTAIFLSTIAIPVYVNLFFFLPVYLHRKKYVAFALLLVANLLVFGFANHLIFNSIIDYILPGYYFISYYSYFDIIKFFAAFFSLTLLLKLTQEWFQLNDLKGKMALLEKEKTLAELKALTYQLNPHFLFNSLNVLYSLAIKESKKTPEAIINLSDLLRYVIYDSNAEYVTLGAEITLIKKYIALQKYRVDKKSQIHFEANVDNEELKVAPMLFLPLLENSFKHGLKRGGDPSYLTVFLSANENAVTFSIENSKDKEKAEPLEHGGVGIKNIQNRLALTYPQKSKFEIEEHKNYFKVNMHINLK